MLRDFFRCDELIRTPLRSRNIGMRELWLPCTMLEADFLVSMPKMKTHHWAGVRLSEYSGFPAQLGHSLPAWTSSIGPLRNTNATKLSASAANSGPNVIFRLGIAVSQTQVAPSQNSDCRPARQHLVNRDFFAGHIYHVWSAKNLCKSQSAKVLVQFADFFLTGDATHHIYVSREGRGRVWS